MLLGAVSVLIVLATGDPGDGSTRAIEQALRAALAADATVEVRASTTTPSPDEATAMGTAKHATLLGLVSWSERQRHVTIRFARLPGGGWTDREIRFDAVDAANERGRTVGFALASMMPDEAFAEAKPIASPPVAPPAVVMTVPANEGATMERPAATLVVRPNPLALDASALAVAAPSGYGGGVGGALALRVPLVGALGARGAFSARAEAIGPAQASAHAVTASAGLAWQPWLDPQHRWAAGARLEGVLLYLDIAHLSEDDIQAKHLSRVMPGAEAAVEGTFRFSDRASVIASIGTEVVFGRTDIYVRERQVTSIPPAKILAELGFRVFFQ